MKRHSHFVQILEEAIEILLPFAKRPRRQTRNAIIARHNQYNVIMELELQYLRVVLVG